MNREKFTTFVALSFALVLLRSGRPEARAQGANTQYPNLASKPSPHTPRCCVGSHG
jgi:hypothetical protein